MGLMGFDNTWYCDKCGEHIKNEDDFIYCPKCGNVLKNDWYQMALQSIEKCLGNFSKSICEDCGEEFDENYNFCPLCSNELKKEGILVSAIRPPSVPKEMSRLRLTIMATHTKEEIECTAKKIIEIWNILNKN